MRGSSNALICTRSLRYAMERSTRRKETGTNVRRHRFILATIPSPPLWASCICAKRPSNGMGLASCFEKNRSNFKAHAMPICKPRGGACSSHRRNRAMPFARDYQGNCKTYSLTAFFFLLLLFSIPSTTTASSCTVARLVFEHESTTTYEWYSNERRGEKPNPFARMGPRTFMSFSIASLLSGSTVSFKAHVAC